LFAAPPAFSDAIARGLLTEVPFVRTDAAGATLSVIWTRRYRRTDILALLNEDGRGGTYSRQPFGDDPLTAVTDDGLVIVERQAYGGEGGAAFGVTLVDHGGDTLWHRDLTYVPEPLPRERVDSAVRAGAESLHEFMSRMDPGVALGDVERRYREATYAPGYLPAVEYVVLASDGSVWLSRTGATGDEMVEWWVLDAAGEPAGRALLPVGLAVHSITGDAVWGVERDDLDVSYIVRYRLIRDT
jgi:hypothetical protein